MTEADVRYAADLLSARSSLAGVESGLAIDNPDMVLKLIAFEGDESGGCHHASALLPALLAPQVLVVIEDMIRRELRRLRVSPEGERETPSKSERCVKGGQARMAALTPERRSEIARDAAKARWGTEPKAEAKTP